MLVNTFLTRINYSWDPKSTNIRLTNAWVSIRKSVRHKRLEEVENNIWKEWRWKVENKTGKEWLPEDRKFLFNRRYNSHTKIKIHRI